MRALLLPLLLLISSCSSLRSIAKDVRLGVIEQLKRAAAAVAAGSLATTVWPARGVGAQTFTLPVVHQCDDSVSLLEGPAGRTVTLIGTAHISEASALLVRKVIQDISPDMVMIELDPKRVGRLPKSSTIEDYGFVLPAGRGETRMRSSLLADEPQASDSNTAPASPSLVSKLLATSTHFAQSAASGFSSRLVSMGGNVVGKALSGFYENVEKMGFNAGGEFKAAVEEGRRVGAKILLGDRDVDATLAALYSAIVATPPAQFEALNDRLNGLMEGVGGIGGMGGAGGVEAAGPSGRELATRGGSGGEDITKAELSSFMERLKTRESITRLTQAMRETAPALYDALIGDRDKYMADAISTSDFKTLVGVVGFAHVVGMEQCLVQAGYRLVKRNCPL